MDLEKRKQYKQFATWLNNNGYLTERFQLIPYELAEMYLESDYYKQLCDGESSDEVTVCRCKTNNISGVINGIAYCEDCELPKAN